jgi:hypothetical protein
VKSFKPRKQKPSLPTLSEEESSSSPSSSLIPTLTTELSARLSRLSSLRRSLREMSIQRSLMSPGARRQVQDQKSKGGDSEPKKKWVDDEDSDDEGRNREELIMAEGSKKGKRKVTMPKAEKGIGDGARVWKWKMKRQR